jgi:hypothetical protein
MRFLLETHWMPAAPSPVGFRQWLPTWDCCLKVLASLSLKGQNRLVGKHHQKISKAMEILRFEIGMGACLPSVIL